MTNSLGMRLAYIPAGEFLMGSPTTEKGRYDDETKHRVKLTEAFYLGVHEVTMGEWKSIMGSEPWKGKDYVKVGASYPAAYISWDDAVEFCDALTKRERTAGRIAAAQSYRLPTEAEWEYACRAGSTTRFHFGDDPSKLKEYAWFGGNRLTIVDEFTHVVGSKKPNKWGLYDMHGNVHEWCLDRHNDYPDTGVTDPIGTHEDFRRGKVYRGGGSFSLAQGVRSANRRRLVSDYRDCVIGFRVAFSRSKPDK